MKRNLVLGMALVLLAGTARGNFCARDVVPAATLLFPYVTVDMAGDVPDPNGWTTVTGITNVGPEAVIVHFTVWDAASVPRYKFDEVLSGYDVLEINWRDFLNGRFDVFDTSTTAFAAPSAPLTLDPFEWGPDGRAQSGASNLTTPQNRTSISGTTGCATLLPYGNRSALSSSLIGTLSGVLIAYSHAGCPGTVGRPLRTDKTPWAPAGHRGRYPLFFYVTADVVNTCNLALPTDAAYWALYATTRNVLIGDVVYRNAERSTSEVFPAVHIEAAASVPRVTTFPFYGEKALTSETRREPLGTAFAFRYANDPNKRTASNVLVWKNLPEVTATGKVDDCGSFMYYAWDNDERSLSRSARDLRLGGPDPNQFPLETQKVPLNNTFFDLPAADGWMLLVLPPSYVNSGGWSDPTTTTSITTRGNYMGWAGVELIRGGYPMCVEAATVASYWCYASQVLPRLGANPGLAIANTYGIIAAP